MMEKSSHLETMNDDLKQIGSYIVFMILSKKFMAFEDKSHYNFDIN